MTSKATQELVAPLAILPDEGGDNRSIAKQCLENIEQNWFTFSRVMFRIYRQEEFKEWGYSSFKDYVEAELAFKYKSAMWRVQIGEAIEQFNITQDEVADMGGWTKFGFLTPKITKDMKRKDFLALIKMAKDMTAREVKDYVETTHNDTEITTKRATLTFLLTNESIEVVREALTDAKGLAGSESDTVGLEYICTEWLMNKNPKKAEEIQAKLHAPPVAKEPKVRRERTDVRKKKSAEVEVSEDENSETETTAKPKAKAKAKPKAKKAAPKKSSK